MTVWSLEDKSVQYIPYPKHKGSQGIAFSPSGNLMALVCAPQDGNGETIGIYDISQSSNWHCVHQFELTGTLADC